VDSLKDVIQRFGDVPARVVGFHLGEVEASQEPRTKRFISRDVAEERGARQEESGSCGRAAIPIEKGKSENASPKHPC
jgi:hypothetical protein